jgi:hypothetical protein
MTDTNSGRLETTTSNIEVQEATLAKVEVKPEMHVGGSLTPSDYITNVPVSQKTSEELAVWAGKQRETTRTNLAMWLVKVFGCSLAASFILVGVTAFSPEGDKTFIKDFIPQIITPQLTLLGVAIGFYFGTKEK